MIFDLSQQSDLLGRLSVEEKSLGTDFFGQWPRQIEGFDGAGILT